MARTKGSSGARTQQAIRRAGLKLIYQHGYEAMSLRDLAREVGIQQGSLYNHIASKQSLLLGLMKSHLETLIAEVNALLTGTPDPIARLKAFIAFHLSYHMERRSEVYINNSELRSLTPKNLAVITGLRRAYEQVLIGILNDGMARKVLRVTDATVTAYAIIAQLTGICAWYKPNGRLNQDQLVALHTELVLKGVAA